jgi:NAD(P)-dependent dehydrogenase (short-subunit alcohol dehydrogenase family)
MLSEHGFRVFAGVRTTSDTTSLGMPDGRGSSGAPRISTIPLDVTKEDQVAAACAVLRAELETTGLAGLVNNAGIAITGPLEYLPLSRLREQFEINVIGQVAITQAVLPLLRLARGRIVNMGSTSGRIADRFAAPYCASKFAMEAITSALRLELRPFGIHVSMVEPGVVATPFWEKVFAAERDLALGLPGEGSRNYGKALESRRVRLAQLKAAGASPEVVCRSVLHALTARAPKLRYVVGSDAKLRTIVAAMLPERVWFRIVARRSRDRGSHS